MLLQVILRINLLTFSFQVTGRILIDFFGYKKHHEGLQRQGNSAHRGRGRRSEETNRIPDPNEAEQSSYAQTLDKEKQEENKEEMLARVEDLVFVSPVLLGFALKNKLWRTLSTSGMSLKYLSLTHTSSFLC
jgi:hypothetical protein